MPRAIIVAINGVTQAPADFVTKGHTIVFKAAPRHNSTVQLTTITANGQNQSAYVSNGIQTTFNLPAYPKSNFEVVADSYKAAPDGYIVVDVNHEIEAWIVDSCPPSEWKWHDPIPGTNFNPGSFGMMRMIIRDSLLTFIATKWS